MEPLRLLQRRAVQQLVRTRPVPGHPSQPLLRSRPVQNTFSTRNIHNAPRPSSSPFLNIFRWRIRFPRRNYSDAAAPTQNLTLSQRLKKLSRDYGWSAVGVYLMLSVLDFPFCFLAVRILGTDRIGHWEHVILGYIRSALKWPVPEETHEIIDRASQKAEGMMREPLDDIKEGQKRLLDDSASFGLKGPSEGEDVGPKRILEEDYGIEEHGYKEAEKANKGADASIWTQLALAYAIHKSFIFIRVPLTAAVTPKVVKTLRSWGWNIGKMPKRKGVTAGQGSSANVTTKGPGVKSD